MVDADFDNGSEDQTEFEDTVHHVGALSAHRSQIREADSRIHLSFTLPSHVVEFQLRVDTFPSTCRLLASATDFELASLS